MKLISKKIITLGIAAVTLASCKKDLLDINTDPNNPTTASATAGLVLPNALNVTASIMNNPTADSRFAFAGIWMGHISYSGNYAIPTESISYNITNTFAANAFGSLYDNINDYDFVERKGIEQGNVFYEGIGKLMKAYNFQTLVDLYGNVPYSEALRGTTVSRPKYDNAVTIYEDIARKMDTAAILFGRAASGGTTITGDVMFKGNALLWQKFANTVKLRLLIRQSEKGDRQSYVTSQLSRFNASTPFLDVDATVNPGYLNSAGKTNPFWGSNVNVAGTYTQDFYRAGQYAINFFRSNNDPRLGRFFKPVGGSGTNFAGNFFGDQGLTNSRTSEFGPGVLKNYDQPAIIMLAAESWFLLAEARVRGWIPGDAQAAYQKGVEASFVFLGLTAANAQTYYNQAGNKETNWAAAANNSERIALIIRQKWAALTLINELEPYNDYRRLRLPADVPLSRSPFSSGRIPNRLLYPQREYEVNAENAPSNVTPNDKIFWIP